MTRTRTDDKTTDDTENCPSCGENFVCGAKKSECWCFSLEISPSRLAQLNEQFPHCLCPQCLPEPQSKK